MEIGYLWPPRPRTAIPPKIGWKMLGGPPWVAQLKLNGQRCLIYVGPDGLQMWDRHHKPIGYDPPDWLVDEIRSATVGVRGLTVIDGELLHNKDRAIKHTLYWWDLLVHDDQYLVGHTYEDRYNRLLKLVGLEDAPPPDDMVYKVSEHIWVAYNIEAGKWDEAWKHTTKSWVEGVVFKRLDAKLRPCVTPQANSDWMIRCRKPTKNYMF